MSRGLLVLALAMAPLVALATPVPKIKETSAQRLIRLFGEPKVPDEHCKVELKGDVLRMTGEGPGHTWLAGPGGMQIPFVVREIKGDFVASVKVKAVDLPEQGFVTGVAGLFVMKDDTVAVDHSLYLTGNRSDTNRRGWLRSCGGENMVHTKEDRNDAFKDEEVALKLERAGNKITASVSSVGKSWVEIESYELPLEKSVRLGVFVAHATGEFSAEFRDFSITSK